VLNPPTSGSTGFNYRESRSIDNVATDQRNTGARINHKDERTGAIDPSLRQQPAVALVAQTNRAQVRRQLSGLNTLMGDSL
jgi:hypothetical protein